MSQLEDRYIILKREDLDAYQTEVIEQFIQAQRIKLNPAAVVFAESPIYPAVERIIAQYAADPEGAEMLYAQESPEASVAAVAVQVIGELNRMLLDGWAHDEKSVAMVMGTCAWLTSVLDGKAANPTAVGEGFVNACTAVDQSILDEVDRFQHFLSETLKAKKQAESKALLNELYAGWYLRLRDMRAGGLVVIDINNKDNDLVAEDLDAAMEDLDEPSVAVPPPDAPKPSTRDPLFDEFDDDVML